MTKDIKAGKIVVVCEGEKTEPYFVWDLFNYLTDEGVCDIQKPSIEPAPADEAKVQKLTGETRGSQGRNIKKLQRSNESTNEDNGMPLNLVNKAEKYLEYFSEAWVLYDNDEHPRLQKALDKILEMRKSGLNINLAFSSRSFEYYMLLHHEYLVHTFGKTECYDKENGKHKYRHCCSRNQSPKENACDGNLEHGCCINGYARRKGYWEKSKSEGVLANINSLWTGINNACRLKWESIERDGTTNLYCRNPFLNSYRLVLRFMGIQSLEQDKTVNINYNGHPLSMSLTNDYITIGNPDKVNIIIPPQDMIIYDSSCVDKKKHESGFHGKKRNLNRFVMLHEAEGKLDISPMNTLNDYAIILIDGKRVFLRRTLLSRKLTIQEKEFLNWAD